jgi:putative DNA primase/helicase
MGYAAAVYDYRKAGWKGALPLPSGSKAPVPAGFTGVSGGWPDADQIKSWARGKFKEGNLGLRMPEDVIGLDIDQGYHGKQGMSTIEALEAKWGKLPATFTSGSREVGGIRYFRVPKEHNLPGQAGPDVEIIQFHHRYSVVWPSIHPETGNQYVWRDRDGEVVEFIPEPSDFPDLPKAWFEGLQQSSFERSSEANLSDQETETWFSNLRVGEPCESVSTELSEALADVDGSAGSRHDAALKHVWALLGMGAKGHAGAGLAIEELEGAFVLAVAPERQGGVAEAQHEFQSMVVRGVRKRASVFAAPAPQCMCDPLAGKMRGQRRLAARMAAEHEGELIFVAGLKWLYWDGQRWAMDSTGQATRAVSETLDRALDEADSLPPLAGAALLQDVRACEGANQMSGVKSIASSNRKMVRSIDDLDSEPLLFNTPNGTLDLEANVMREHDPEDKITKISRGSIGGQYKGSKFEGFLTTVLPNDEVRKFVQRLIGYAMLGEVREHVLPIFTGVGGNGKGTLLEAVKFAFGDYAISTDPGLLIDQGNAHPTGQADLFGKRLAITSETNEKEKLAASTVKRLTGGDTVKARYMREDFFEFRPSHLIIMMTNHKPEVSGDDAAMWRRILIVPFDEVIENPDVELPGNLEKEADVIMTWAVDGFKEYKKQGLNPPAEVEFRTLEYRADVDPVQRFLTDATHRVAGEQGTGLLDLYRGYCDWSRENGEDIMSSREFADSMKRHGYDQGRTGKGRFYQLKSDPNFRVVLGEKAETQDSPATPAPAVKPGKEIPPSSHEYRLQEGEQW